MQTINTGWQRSGKNSRVQVGSNILAMSSFDVSVEATDLDTVNFTSAGADEGITGIYKATLSFKGDWDARLVSNGMPFGNPPGIFPRDDLQNVTFTINISDGNNWNFPYARIRSARTASDVTGKVSFDASGFNQGSFIDPSNTNEPAYWQSV
jgi:hypothetical protein